MEELQLESKGGLLAKFLFLGTGLSSYFKAINRLIEASHNMEGNQLALLKTTYLNVNLIF
jgi:hypothetical protein